MNRKRTAGIVVVLGVLAYIGIAMAQVMPNVSQDPCNNFAKLTAPIAIATAATTRIINNTSGPTSSVYVCSMWLNSVGGTSTIEYGTGASCATAATAVALTGAVAAATTISVNASGGSVLVVPPVASTALASTVGNSVCILSGASTTATEGWMTYVITGPM
jgi:hypothetical protein